MQTGGREGEGGGKNEDPMRENGLENRTGNGILCERSYRLDGGKGDGRAVEAAAQQEFLAHHPRYS